MPFIAYHHAAAIPTLNQIIIVSGISGSGKDHLIDKAKESGSIPTSFQTISTGEMMFAFLKKKHPEIHSRDDLKLKVQEDDIREAYQHVTDTAMRSQPAVLNTHMVTMNHKSFAIEPDITLRMSPKSFVYVWAEPEQIMAWRK